MKRFKQKPIIDGSTYVNVRDDKPRYNNIYLKEAFLYKDETWNRVINRWQDRRRIFWGLKIPKDRDNDCKNRKIQFNQDGITIRSEGIKDDWIYLIDKREITNFILEFKAIFYTEFREIQFAFRHVDFYNRYRFRIEGGYLYFDIIYKGIFFNNIAKTDFKPELKKVYNFKIWIDSNKHIFLINSIPQLIVEEKITLFKNGSYAIVLWDPSGYSNIKVEYKDIKLYKTDEYYTKK